MTNDNGNASWRITRAIPITLVAGVVVQALWFVVWAVRLEGRVTQLEISHIAEDKILDRYEHDANTLAIFEDRQARYLIQIENLEKEMERISREIRTGVQPPTP